VRANFPGRPQTRATGLFSRVLWSLLALAATTFAPAIAPAFADVPAYSYITLRIEPGVIEGTVAIDKFDVAHDLQISRPYTLLTPEVASRESDAFVGVIGRRLQILVDGKPLQIQWGHLRPLPDGAYLSMPLRITLASTPGAFTVVGPLITYIRDHETYVNVYEGTHLTQGILTASNTRFEYFTGSRQGALAVVKKFLPAGIHHILIGPDHILFLVGLLLLGGTVRRLLGIITAFTVAHSITLSLAALSIVHPSSRIVEPAIALSIMYVGIDNVLAHEGRDWRPLIAFAFGFIHGFGFASVLQEMDLPRAALGWSLFAFNAGVEVGQMIVVVPVATAVGLLRKSGEVAGRRLVFVGSAVVIAAAGFWFVQRVFFPES
jgi:hydrogenase/urease accessory protein HupE